MPFGIGAGEARGWGDCAVAVSDVLLDLMSPSNSVV